MLKNEKNQKNGGKICRIEKKAVLLRAFFGLAPKMNKIFIVLTRYAGQWIFGKTDVSRHNKDAVYDRNTNNQSSIIQP